MILHPPFSIGSRLLPSLTVGDGTLSLEQVGRDRFGRGVYRWYVDILAGEFSAADLVGPGGLQAVFGSLLAFLGAAAESYGYSQRSGQQGENSDLFPPAVVEWAYQHSDELSMLQCEIEESGELIEA